MITAEGMRRYNRAVYNAGTKYVYGMDMGVLTKDKLQQLIKLHGSENYTNINIALDEGKLGCDCSGLSTLPAGYDTTAAGHFERCPERGAIKNMPKNKVCLIFKKGKEKIDHMGVYEGNGMLTEMKNDCQHRAFKTEEWDYYGIPSWIIQDEETTQGGTVTLTVNTPGYNSSTDAIAGTRLRVMVSPGDYYVYKVVPGSINVSKKKDSPGSWIKWP